jgi:hypothetical protein
MNDPMPVFTIKAKDRLALFAVAAYAALCDDHDLHRQSAEVRKAIAEMRDWQERHPDLVQWPDHPHVSAAAARRCPRCGERRILHSKWDICQACVDDEGWDAGDGAAIPIPGDPQAVVAAMAAAGWEQAGGRADCYVRLRWPGGQRTMIVPLRPDCADYGDLMGAVLAELARSAVEGARSRRVLDALSIEVAQ